MSRILHTIKVNGGFLVLTLQNIYVFRSFGFANFFSMQKFVKRFGILDKIINKSNLDYKFDRAIITFPAVAPVPMAVLTVGESGLATSPTAKMFGKSVWQL